MLLARAETLCEELEFVNSVRVWQMEKLDPATVPWVPPRPVAVEATAV